MIIKKFFPKLLLVLTVLLVVPFVSLAGKPDTTAPAFVKAIADVDIVTISYDEDLDPSSTPSASDFSFTQNGSPISITSVNISADEVTLELSTAVTYGATFLLNYTIGASPIQDIAGNDAFALASQTVQDYDCSSIDVGLGADKSILVGNELYVLSGTSSTVTVVNTDTKRVITTINLGVTPNSAVLVGDYLYISDSSQSALFVVDTTTYAMVATPTVGNSPTEMVSYGGKIYVVNSGEPTVSVVDVSDPGNPVVSATISVGTNPRSIFRYGAKIYVISASGTVTLIDTTNDTASTVISVAWTPFSATVAGSKIYVNQAGGNFVSVIDPMTDTVTDTITVGFAPRYSVAVGGSLYVVNTSTNNVSVIDLSDNTVTTTISGGFAPTFATAVGTDLYVSNTGGNTMLIIDTADNSATTFSVGVNPAWSTLVGTDLYVSNTGSSSNVSVINTETQTLFQCAVVATHSCTYSAGTGGSISGDTNQTVNDGSSATSVTANPNKGYVFEKWDDDIVSNPRTDTKVTKNINVTALFKQVVTYELNYLAGPGGSITGNTSQTVEEGADGKDVTAVPDPGYVFEKWDDGVLDNPRLDKSVKAKLTVTASFVLEEPKDDGKPKKQRTVSGHYSPAVKKETPQSPTNPTVPIFSTERVLKLGVIGEDVRLLQAYLNTHKFPVAQSGLGSAGNETTKFGPMTKAAVIKFQLAHNLVGDGVVGPKTAALMK